MILKEKKIIFVHAPRTSGTSIEKSILQGKLVPDYMKHLRASQFRKMFQNDWDKFYKFTIVRNPWDRVISMYHQPYFKEIGFLSGKPLRHFLDNYKPAPWEHGIQCSDYADTDMDLVIKFEDREIGLEKLFLDIHIRVDTKIKERSTKRDQKHYSSFYDDQTREIVSLMFEEDIKRYTYVF
jgi:hypothetical protein